MKKRILSMLLTIVIVVGLVPGFTLTASAATAVPRITGVKVLINGVEQPEGEIAITDSDTVTVVYTGENFGDLGKNNQDYHEEQIADIKSAKALLETIFAAENCE